jgi:hypothetical protein
MFDTSDLAAALESQLFKSFPIMCQGVFGSQRS